MSNFALTITNVRYVKIKTKANWNNSIKNCKSEVPYILPGFNSMFVEIKCNGIVIGSFT